MFSSLVFHINILNCYSYHSGLDRKHSSLKDKQMGRATEEEPKGAVYMEHIILPLEQHS